MRGMVGCAHFPSWYFHIGLERLKNILSHNERRGGCFGQVFGSILHAFSLFFVSFVRFCYITTGAGNNPMVGMTVACAVAVEEAMAK